MLTPNALAKATPGYRSGYSDAIREMPNDPTHGNAHACGVWFRADYADGYSAGLSDMALGTRVRASGMLRWQRIDLVGARKNNARPFTFLLTTLHQRIILSTSSERLCSYRKARVAESEV